jgi:hypothetical protein
MSNEVIYFVCTKESKQQKNKNIKKLKKVTEGKTESGDREILFWGIFEI